MMIERLEVGASRPSRKRAIRPAVIFGLGFCLLMFAPRTASAYIDPGAGSFVVQAVIAMFAGVAVVGRLYWGKIKKFLGMGSPEDKDDPLDDDD